MSIISFQHFIPSVIEAMFPRWMGDKLGLFFELDMRYHKPGCHDNDIRIYRRILIHRPMNYTKVLVSSKVGVRDFNLNRFKSGRWIEYFDKRSDHDSCWRHDGFNFIFNDYVNASEKLEMDVPKDMESDFGFGLCGDPTFVHIKEMKPNRQDNGFIRGYWVELEVPGTIPLSEVHKYIPKQR